MNFLNFMIESLQVFREKMKDSMCATIESHRSFDRIAGDPADRRSVKTPSMEFVLHTYYLSFFL